MRRARYARADSTPFGRSMLRRRSKILAIGPSPEHARLILKLETLAVLSAQGRAALAALPLRLKSFDENTDLMHEGDRPSECCLIVDGMACRYKLMGAGKRQIVSFHLPGEIPNLCGLHLAVMDHGLGAFTPGRAAYVAHTALRQAIADHPDIAAAFWRDSLVDAAISREWLAGVGRRTARARIAHLICELCMRLRALGLIQDHIFELPVTQAELGDALGLTPVHVNRVLQQLRRDGLIVSHGKTLVISDWNHLRQAADFDPTYLHLRELAAA